MVGMNNQNSNSTYPKPARCNKTIIRIDAAVTYTHIKNLLLNGVDGFSIRPADGPQENWRQLFEDIRRAAKETVKEAAIIQELAGPQLSLGDFTGVINVRRGQSLAFAYRADYALTGQIPLRYDLSRVVKRGERLILFANRVSLVVTAVRSGVIYAEAQTAGMLIKDKEVVLPDTDFAGDIITAQDRNELIFALSQDVDYISLGLVQTAADVSGLKQLLRGMHSNAKLIVSIKTRQSLRNLDGIAAEADMLLADTAALALATTPADVPAKIRKIVVAARKLSVPTIIKLPPGNLDQSDQMAVAAVASSYSIGPDAVLFESVESNRDLAAVALLNHVATAVPPNLSLPVVRSQSSFQETVLRTALDMAQATGAKAVVTDTGAEGAVIGLAALRRTIPLVALTDDRRLLRQLAIIYGVETNLCSPGQSETARLNGLAKSIAYLNDGDVVVVVGAHHPGTVGAADTLQVRLIG